MRDPQLVQHRGSWRRREDEVRSKLDILRPEPARNQIVLCCAVGRFDDGRADEGVGETDLAKFGGGERVGGEEDVREEGLESL